MASNFIPGRPTAKERCNISNLMSPPEGPPLDGFHSGGLNNPEAWSNLDGFLHGPSSKQPGEALGSEVRRLPPLSPPVSPATRDITSVYRAQPLHTAPVADPILYPAQDQSSPPSQELLFPKRASETSLIDEHVARRQKTLFQNVEGPRRAEYQLVKDALESLAFRPRIIGLYKQDPKAWLVRERHQLKADRQASAAGNPRSYASGLAPILPARPQVTRPQSSKVTKPVRAARPSAAKAPSKKPAAPRAIRSNPVQAGGPLTQPAQLPVQPAQLGRALVVEMAQAPQQPPKQAPPAAARRKSRTPEAASKRQVAPKREDTEFHLLPDYCPPIDTLPESGHFLKTAWTGNPIDLSADPHRHLLHPDEVRLASQLRLDCATYLTSKRRIFMGRLDAHYDQKKQEFRKTHAQQACNIDVNKASRLWTAFDSVGWLSRDWIQRFPKPPRPHDKQLD